LMRLSKLEDEAEFALVPASEAVECAVSKLASLIEETGASVTYDRNMPSMVMDKPLMATVFQNLIENAIKYNEHRPVIDIRCENEGKNWEFSVQDNGIGIAETDLERVFLFQVRTVKDENGRGVGLALCRKIVAIHGGRIWAESSIGKGSTFRFTVSKKLLPRRGQDEVHEHQ